MKVYDKIDTSPLANPSDNYDILEHYLTAAYNEAFPTRFVKFNKFKHKRNRWIIDGIIRSNHFRDNIYKTLRQCGNSALLSGLF